MLVIYLGINHPRIRRRAFDLDDTTMLPSSTYVVVWFPVPTLIFHS